MASDSEEEENYIRMGLLMTGLAARAVRVVFDRKFHPLQSTLRQEYKKLKFLFDKHNINQVQWNMLFSNPDSQKFDIALMTCLLSNIAKLRVPQGLNLPPKIDISIGADLARIRHYRNFLAHLNECRVDTFFFESAWNDMCDVIGRLGGAELHQECLNLRTKILDKSNQESFRQIKSCRDEIEILKNGIMKQIPEQIKQMDDNSIKRYIQMLEKGKETKRDIRVVVVGKQGSGKTSLVRRILKEDTGHVLSTNGIEIHRRKCKVHLESKKWITNLKTDAVSDINIRLSRHFNKTCDTVDVKDVYDQKDIAGKGLEKETLDSHQQDQYNLPSKIKSLENMASSTEFDRKEIEHVMSIDVPDDDDQYANVTFWDFAGHKEFYNTHHMFLSTEAIYLVVTRLDEKETEAEGTLRFWFNSIHHYGRKSETDEKSDKVENKDELNPPVIAIGTCTDRCQNKSLDEELKNRIQTSLGKSVSMKHLRRRFCVSNTKDEDHVFDNLRTVIIKLAQELPVWELPILFIELEKKLQILYKTSKIMPFDELMQLGKDLKPVPLTDTEDLELFLRYHHNMGNLIFFTSCPNYIILDPQWLIDAFKCIISAYDFLKEEVNCVQLDIYLKTGELSERLLNELFSTQPQEIKDNKDHILQVMENFDLIIKPHFPKGKDSKEFYVPCIIQNEASINIEEKIPKPDTKTSCLCFQFSFLSPPLMNHLLFACIRKFVTSEYGLNGELFPALFQNMAVFDTDESGCEKLVVATFQNTIQIQIWKYGSECYRQYTDIKDFIENTIKEITKQRLFCQLNLDYTIRFKCSDTKYNCLNGVMDLNLYNKPYICKEHNVLHVIKNEWFENSTPEEGQNTEPSNTEQSEARSESGHLKLCDRGLFPTPNNQPIPLEMNNAVVEGAVGYHWAVMNYRGQMQHNPRPTPPQFPFIDEASCLDMSFGTDPYDKLFLKIGKKIVLDWKMVGRHLGLSEDNISIIESNYTKIEEKSYQMLRRWRSLRGNNASKADLIQALEDCELRQVAKIVQGFVLEGEDDQETTYMYMKAIEEGSD